MNIVKYIEFPHISRIFSALLWLALVSFIFINIYAKRTLTPLLWPRLIATLRAPTNPTLHTNLAKYYWDYGLLAESKKELALIDQANNVLGTATPPLDLFAQWEKEPLKNQQLLVKWERIIQQYPDYRDAYLIAATLLYELGKAEEAHALATTAIALDPNNPIASRLLMILSQY